MSKKEIEIHVDKDNKIDFKEFIEMKIKYDEEYFKKDKEIERLTENNQAMQEELCKVWNERDNAYRRILEAVDNLETPYFRECEQQCKDTINILKGSEKE